MEAYLSMIASFGCNFTIRQWALCHGAFVDINQNSALYSLLGTIYGGNSTQNFALPDLRGRSGVGKGAGPGLIPVQQGQSGGTEHIQITENNIPPHTHSLNSSGTTIAATADLLVSNDTINTASPDGNYLGESVSALEPQYADTLSSPAGVMEGVVSMPTQTIEIKGNTGATGLGQRMDNRSPYLALNYLICIHGLYPSRD